MLTLRRLVGWPIAHGLYWLGDGFSRVLNWLPDDNSPDMDNWYFNLYYWTLYKPYQLCMIWSVDVNDWAALNVWRKPDEDGPVADE